MNFIFSTKEEPQKACWIEGDVISWIWRPQAFTNEHPLFLPRERADSLIILYWSLYSNVENVLVFKKIGVIQPAKFCGLSSILFWISSVSDTMFNSCGVIFLMRNNQTKFHWLNNCKRQRMLSRLQKANLLCSKKCKTVITKEWRKFTPRSMF